MTVRQYLDALSDFVSHPETLAGLSQLLDDGAALTPELRAKLDEGTADRSPSDGWSFIVGLIDCELPRVSDQAKRADLLSLKGRVLENELLDEPAAVSAFEEALALKPEDERTRQTLDQIRRVQQNWAAIAAKYVEEAEAATHRQLATDLFLSAAEVVWRNDPASPLVEQHLRRALEIEPRNHRASSHLERQLRVQQRHRDLAELLEQRASVAANRDERVQAFVAAAELWAEALGNQETAAEYYRRALSLHPSSAQALRFLVELYTEQENWSTLVRVYEDALRAQPPGDAELGMLLQIGMLYARKLGQWERAEEYLRRVRKTAPTQPVMLDFYREYYRRLGEPAKILALLDSAQRVERDAEVRVDLMREMAEIGETEVGNLDKAIDLWKSIQRMGAEADRTPDGQISYRQMAVVALKRLYRQTHPPKWNALRELLKEEIDALPDDRVEDKIQLMMEVVEIYRDHLRLDVMVINTYNAILAIKPDHRQAVDALVEKYETQGRWNDLIGILQRRVAIETEPEQQIATLHQIARLWIEKFGNHSQAVGPLEQILELDPADAAALDRLREIYVGRRNWRGLLDLLAREAARREGAERRAVYREMAQLAADRLGEPNESIQVWNRVLVDDPDDEEALAKLADLYRREGRWAALAEVLHRQLATLTDGEQRLELLEQLGAIYTDRLRAAKSAIDVWGQILEQRPDHAKALAVQRELLVQQGRWNDLEQLLGDRQLYGELAETLTTAGDRCPDPGTKVWLYRRVGEICEQELGSPERAIKSYERVLAVDPDDIAAAWALVPLYRDGAKWGRLLGTYELLLDHAEALEEQLSLLAQIREVYERQLGAKHLAFEWCARAYQLVPDDPEIVAELQRLAGESEAWEELVEIYRERAEQLEHPEAKAAVLRTTAQLCLEQLHRPADAETFFRALVELEPDDTAALVALEEIYAGMQRWPELIAVLCRQTELEQEVEGKAGLLFKIAFIQEERLGDPGGAIDSYATIVALQPENLRALKALERLYQVRGEWGNLAEVLRRELELAEQGDERVELLVRLGELRDEDLGQPAEAIDAFAEALEIDPVHRGAVASLEQLLQRQGDHRTRVAGLLRPFYERSENWARLRDVLEIQLTVEDDRDQRLAMLRKMVNICDRRLGLPEPAFEASAEILQLDPSDADNREELVNLARRAQRVAELAVALREALEQVEQSGDLGLQRAVLTELARTYDERLEQADAAEPYLRRLVELERSETGRLSARALEALGSLERILRDGGRWHDLRSLLQEWLALTEDEERRKHLLLQISAINEDVLGETEDAVAAYEEILGIDPRCLEAVRALERHYRTLERWDELVMLLTQQLDLVEDEAERREVQIKGAAVRMQHLGDLEGAVDLLESVVRDDPHDDRAVALLEQLKPIDDPSRVLLLLEQVYELRGQWDKLVEILRMRRALIDDRFEAVVLLRRAALLQEQRLDDPDGALQTAIDALVLDTADEQSQAHLERLANMLQRWDTLAGGWRAAIRATEEGEYGLRAQLLAKLAQVQLDWLQQPEAARQTYEEMLQLDPDDPTLAGPAAEALSQLYEEAGMWTELVHVLGLQVGWTEDSTLRGEFLLQIALVQQTRLEDVEAAIGAYRALLDESPRSTVALDALELLYQQQQRWADLIGILRRRVEFADAAAERRELLSRIAGIYQQDLGEREQAIAAYVAIMDEIPDDLPTLQALTRLYGEAERWGDVLEMLERQLPLVEPMQRPQLSFEIATLLHRRMADAGPALDHYRELLGNEDYREAVREALEELLDDAQHSAVVSDLLADLYQRQQRWSDLTRIHELQAAQAGGEERVRLLRLVAKLALERLDDIPRAFAAIRQALSVGDQGDLLALADELCALAPMVGWWAELVDALCATARESIDGQVQRELHLRIAELCRERLGDAERARTHYLEVLDIDPVNEEALRALDGLYREEHDWEALLEILHRRADLAADEEAISHLLEAARLQHQELGRAEDAIADYERVLGLCREESLPGAEPGADPGAETEESAREPTSGSLAQTIEALGVLYEQTERWTELDALLQRQVDLTIERRQQARLCYRLGRLRADRLLDERRAFDAYREAVRLDLEHQEAVEALEVFLDEPDLQAEAALTLEPLYSARQHWPSLIRIYRIRLDAAEEIEERLSLSTRIAQLYEEQLEDLEQAFQWYGKVLAERPDDGSIRDQLLRLAGILDQWQALAETFADCLATLSDDDSTMRELALILGNIYDERLYAWEPARDCFERMLHRDPGDEEAFMLLERLLTRYEKWHELLALYRDRLDATMGEDERRDLMLRICRVWEEALEDLPEAIDSYRALLDVDNNDREAVGALERLYAEADRWLDLAELLEQQLAFVDDPQELVVQKHRLGTVYEERLEDLPRAIDCYEEVLGLQSKHEETIRALERLVLDRDQRFRIAQILEPIYRAQDEWAKLVVIYDAQLAFIEDPGRRIELLREIARLHEERGGSLELAFRAISRAYETMVDDEDLLAWLERLAATLGQWTQMVEVLRRAAGKVYDYDLLGRVHGKIAEIQEVHLGDQEAAVAAWREVLAVKEADEGAIEALLRLLSGMERYEELVEILRRRAEYSSDVEVQRETYRQMALIYQGRLGDSGKAIESWRQVLSIDETAQEALDELRTLFAANEDWMELVWVLQRKIELTVEPAERLALQLELARTYEEKVRDAFEAINAYKAALEWDPGHEGALEALDRLYTDEALWPDLLEIIDRKAERAGGEQLDALRFRAGKILAEEIGDLEQAMERFARVVAADGGHAEARQALQTLLENEIYRERAAEILEQLYLAREEYDRLVGVLEARLRGDLAPEEAHRLWRRIAELRGDRLSDKRGAFDALIKAFEQQPEQDEVRQTLEELASELSLQRELVDAFEQRVEEIYDSDLNRGLRLEIGRIVEIVLQDDERAERHYRAALDLGGEAREPLMALDRVLSRQDKPDDLLEVLERLVEELVEPGAQAEVFCRIGNLRAERRSDLDGALIAFRDALERDPESAAALTAMEGLTSSELHRAAALEVLEPLYLDKQAFDRLLWVLELRLDGAVDPNERVSLRRQIAELQEQKLGSADKALKALISGLREDPGSRDLMEETTRLARQLDRHDEVVREMRPILEGVIEEDVARQLGVRIARWSLEFLNDVGGAEAALLRVLEVSPGAAEALEGLEAIYRGAGRQAELSRVLLQQADSEFEIEAKRARLVEAAQIAEELEDWAGATQAWRAILEFNEGDETALQALVTIFRQQESWEDLVDTIEAQVRNADEPMTQVELKHQIALLVAQQLDDPERAIEIYREILDIEPAEQRALQTLETMYSAREDWSAMQEILLRQVEATGDAGSPEALPILMRLGELCTTMGNVDDAASYYQQILAADPQQDRVRERLEQLLHTAERWYELVELLKQSAELAESLGEREPAIGQLLRSARIWTEKLDNPDAAAEVLESILERDPSHVGALSELAVIYEVTEQWDRCREVLLRAASLNPAPAQEAEIEYRLGQLTVKQGGEMASAAQHYQRALQLDPAHVDAAVALEAYGRETEQWELVAELLSRRLERLPPEEQLPLLQELGQIYGDRLGQSTQSVAIWERARAISPDSREILEPLAEAYYGAQRFEDVEPILENLIAQAGTRRTKDLARYHFRLGSIAERRGQPEKALKCYEMAYRVDSTHAPTLVAMGQIYFAKQDWQAARRVYRSLLLQNIDERSGITRADVFFHLGQVHSALGEKAKALGMFERGLESAPDHAGLQAAIKEHRGG